jgi:hypothetical protein
MAFGGLSDFSAEGIPAGASNVPVWAGGETRSEEPSGNAALAGGSGLGASGGEFGVAGAALAGGSDRAASDGEFGVAGAALAGGSDLAASDGDFCLAGPALAGGSDRVASEGVFGVAAGISDITRSRHSS